MRKPDVCQDLSQRMLVPRIAIAVQEGDRGCTKSLLNQRFCVRCDQIRFQRLEDRPVGGEALIHLDNGFIQRRDFVNTKRKQVRALLIADEQQVAEPSCYE